MPSLSMSSRFVLAALLVAPLASAAEEANGTFEVRGGIVFPPGTSFHGPAQRLVPYTGDSDILLLESPEVTLNLTEKHRLPVAGLAPAPQSRTIAVQNVTIRQAGSGDHQGSIEIVPREACDATFVSTGRANLTERFTTGALLPVDVLAPVRQNADPPRILFMNASGDLSFACPARFVIDGLDLHVKGAGFDQILPTGQVHDDGDVEWRSVSFEVSAGSFHLLSRRSVEVRLQTASVAWDGNASFRTDGGFLRTSDAYHATGAGFVWIAGGFSGSVVMRGAAGNKSFWMTGALDATSLRPDPLPHEAAALAAEPDAGVSPLVPAVGLVIVGVAAAGVHGAWLARRRRRPPFSAEDCRAFATTAAESGRWGQAIDWTRRARAQAPTSTQLALDEAAYLAKAGQVEAAVSILEDVASVTDAGEAEFNAACLLLEESPDVGQALKLAMRALEKSPGWAIEMRRDPWTRLAGETDFEAALRRARRSLDAGPDADD